MFVFRMCRVSGQTTASMRGVSPDSELVPDKLPDKSKQGGSTTDKGADSKKRSQDGKQHGCWFTFVLEWSLHTVLCRLVVFIAFKEFHNTSCQWQKQ